MAYTRSFFFAAEGLIHAIKTEANLRAFLAAYIVTIVAAFAVKVDGSQMIAVLMSGGFFLAVELINTALERFTDAFDTHSKNQNDIHFEAIKKTKDVAAAASLVSVLVWIVVLAIIFGPHLPRVTGH